MHLYPKYCILHTPSDVRAKAPGRVGTWYQVHRYAASSMFVLSRGAWRIYAAGGVLYFSEVAPQRSLQLRYVELLRQQTYGCMF